MVCGIVARPIETFPIRKRDLSRVIKVGVEGVLNG